MPGEPKPQLPQKTNDTRFPDIDDCINHEVASIPEIHPESSDSPWEMVDISQWDSELSIKQESIEDGTDEEIDDMDEVFDQPLQNITRQVMEAIDRKPLSNLPIGISKSNIRKLRHNKIEELSISNLQPLSPIPSLHISSVEEKPNIGKITALGTDDQLHLQLQFNEDTISSDIEKALLQTSDEEPEEKPSWLVDQKPPLPPIKSELSTIPSMQCRPFVEPKKETVIVEEEKIETEKPIISMDVSYHNVQIKTEEEIEQMPALNEVNVIGNGMPVKQNSIEIKTEDVDFASETQSNADLELSTVAVKDEPVEEGKLDCILFKLLNRFKQIKHIYI